MAIIDPVMHALLDLCQAIGNHPSPQIHTAYDNALRVIREHTGFVPGFSSCHQPEALQTLANAILAGDDRPEILELARQHSSQPQNEK
jgi:hypothetical protein